MTATAAQSGQGTSKRALGIVGALLLVGVIIAVVIALASGGSDDADPAQAASARIPQGAVRQVSFADITGSALPQFESDGADVAVGMDAPAFTASYFDNTEVTVTPGDGTPRVMLFLAHWCPHCQAEVQSLTDWFATNGVPTDVDVVAVSTGVDQGAPNYPPATWLLREGWPIPVVRDSAHGDLAAGYGLTSFPYLVAVDGDGKVVSRSSGQLGDSQWQTILNSLST